MSKKAEKLLTLMLIIWLLTQKRNLLNDYYRFV